jgi:hypothetical protein
MFYKNTIMGQVLKQVHDDKNNGFYFEQIDELIEDIIDREYLDADQTVWNKSGVIVTDESIHGEQYVEWTCVKTDDVFEFSWLIEQLVEIYQPKITESYRLLSTIGYLLNIYSERYEDLTEILKVTTITSTVFLHPDHVGQDKFRVHPITLPPFSSEF